MIMAPVKAMHLGLFLQTKLGKTGNSNNDGAQRPNVERSFLLEITVPEKSIILGISTIA